MQTTFVHAVRGLRRGVVPVSEPAWLLGIARNVCLSRRESSARRSRLEEVCDPAVLERAAGAPDVPREELIGLERALQRLPEQQRRAILLRDWRGLSYDEVAVQLGVSRAAVEALIFRGRDGLAGLLRDEAPAPRRRLLSLGNVASALSALKHAFAGGAALTKVAAAAVTAVAVTGSGVAIGSALERGDEASTSRTPPAPLRAEPAVAATPPSRGRADASAPAPRERPGAVPAAAAVPVVAAPDRPSATADEEHAAGAPAAPPAATAATPLAPETPSIEAPKRAAPPLEAPPLEAPPLETPPLETPELPAPVQEVAETLVTDPETIAQTVAGSPATIEETVTAASATVADTVASATAVVAPETEPPPAVTLP